MNKSLTITNAIGPCVDTNVSWIDANGNHIGCVVSSGGSLNGSHLRKILSWLFNDMDESTEIIVDNKKYTLDEFKERFIKPTFLK